MNQDQDLDDGVKELIHPQNLIHLLTLQGLTQQSVDKNSELSNVAYELVEQGLMLLQTSFTSLPAPIPKKYGISRLGAKEAVALITTIFNGDLDRTQVNDSKHEPHIHWLSRDYVVPCPICGARRIYA